MDKIYDVVFGEDTGKRNPNTGKNYIKWVNCGFMLKDRETGRLSIKLTAVPTSLQFDGWLTLFKPKDENQTQNDTVAKTSQDPLAKVNEILGTTDEDQVIDLNEIAF